MAVETGSSKKSGEESKKRVGQIEIQEAKTDSYLSNERTFLNWIRTSLGAFILGFIVARFGLWFDQLTQSNQNINGKSADNILSMGIGIGIIALAAAMAVIAVYRYRAVNEVIRKGGGEISTRLPIYVAVATIGIAAFLIFYLLVIFQSF